MPDYELLDSNETVLVTLVKPYVAVDGKSYRRIWGAVTVVKVARKTFIQIGGFGKEVMVRPADIRSAQIADDKPVGDDILILDGEFNDLAADPKPMIVLPKKAVESRSERSTGFDWLMMSGLCAKPS